MRQLNSSALMRFALRAHAFTAATAMEETGLTRATVIGLCSDLVDAGWLEKVADSREAGLTRMGRPAHRYRLREDAGTIAALDAGEHSFTAIVADLRGSVLARHSLTLDSAVAGRQSRVDTARDMLSRTLEKAGRAPGDLVLTVVGIPAPVDGDGRSPSGGSGFWPLMNAGFDAGLSGRVVVENDANLAALAEQAQQTTPSDNTATLLTGERFGTGLIVDGRLLHGSRGGAGETRFLDTIFDDGYASDGIGALARRWARAAVTESDQPSVLRDIDTEHIEATDVFYAAAAGDALAHGIISDLGSRLARVSVVLSSLLDVERIVVAGAIARALDPVVERARHVLTTEFPPPVPELAISALGGDVVVRGGIELALQRIREQPSDFLPRRPASAPHPHAG